MGDPADAFGLFVSSVEGNPVHRFGSKVLIGADVDFENPGKIRYRTGDVIAIPQNEALRYAREYGRLIADGALVARSVGDWRGQQLQPTEGGAPREKPKPAGPPDPVKAEDDGASEGSR